MKDFRPRLFHTDRTGLKKALGDLECDIMECAWRNLRVSVRDVHDELAAKRELAYTTVMTVMSRLGDKGLLRKEKVGKQYYYTPAISREDFSNSLVRSVVAGLGTDLAAPALAYFVDNLDSGDEALLCELERLIAEKRKSAGEQ